MKKIIIGLLVLLSVSAAKANNISEKVQKSFEKEFSKATNVNWIEKGKNIFQVTFTYNGASVEAYFDGEGSLLSTVRLISEQQLPVMIIRSLFNYYADYSIRRAEECNLNGSTYYLVTIYNNAETITLKFSSNGDEQRVNRIKNKNSKKDLESMQHLTLACDYIGEQ
ncbi:MAG: PepSY-like domain-containing protein [Bacteroidetes bacterium]|nr:PepSY-like domain-containing protein [Bacteroidota bacterium]